MSYKFLGEIAIADAAFEAEAGTLNNLFRDCAIATFETMVDTEKVELKVKRKIKLENEDLEKLLFEFLEELIFLKDKDSLVFSKFNVKIEEGFKLKAEVIGDKIDHEKQKLRSDVKAVTFHKFKVEKIGNKYKAFVILDI